MKVFQTDQNGYFVGVVHADPDPLTPDEWLIPGGCVTVAPPENPEGRARFVNGNWIVEPTPEPEPEPEPQPFTVNYVKAEAARRIKAFAPLWRQLNAMREGDTALFEQIDAIRAASDKLEALDPIPDPATWDGWP